MVAVLEEANLAKEGLSFRHDLGEFNEKDFKTQLEESEQRIEKCDADLKQASQLKAKFISAFLSEEELEDSLPPPPPAPTPPPPEEPAEAKGEPSEEEEESSEAEEEPAEAGAEPAEEAPAGDFEQDATALLALPRLVALAPDGTEEEYPLAMGTTSIGRLDDNDICIPHGTVSRHHARIEMSEDGFTIYDMGSENGILINGERVTECRLAADDRIEIGQGTKEFVFKFGESD
jgi:hypothetical protein